MRTAVRYHTILTVGSDSKRLAVVHVALHIVRNVVVYHVVRNAVKIVPSFCIGVVEIGAGGWDAGRGGNRWRSRARRCDSL